jgi:Domain of unknown function (DUF1929)/Fibronectin type III domain
MPLPSVTHGFNMSQRISRPRFSQTAGGLNMTVPSSSNKTPPGYYMLFILNSDGVPSVAKMVQITTNTPTPTPTAAPSPTPTPTATATPIPTPPPSPTPTPTATPTPTPAPSPTPTPIASPQAPTNLSATAISSSQINLSWTDNSNNETGFKVERSKNGRRFKRIATVDADVTTYSNTGLHRRTTYYYRVRAYNEAGNSDYSNIASATTNR